MGAHSLNKDRVFTWLDGSIVNTTEIKIWHDNDLNRDRCLSSWKGAYGDVNCDTKRDKYICEL